MEYEYIDTEQHLRDYCDALATAQSICFDTEFVSEYTYRPDLCLIQVAADGKLAVIDPRHVSEIKPFWDCLTAPGHETIVHAAREEFRFCLQATGRRPTQLFDVQVAAGLVGMEYPAAYHKLLQGLLGKRLKKAETRTDWRRRPLSQRQIEYALLDVVYLQSLRDRLHEQLDSLGRITWMTDEMDARQAELEEAETRERWRRVSGTNGLSNQALCIVRELWRWREDEAARRDCPVRRVLRDDLLVELARRGTAEVKQIRSLRGMERGDLQRQLPKISSCIRRALSIAESDWPKSRTRRIPNQVTVLSQFLATALSSLCRSQQISHSIVGTVQDLRDLIAYRLGFGAATPDEPPRLATGWRAEIIGQLIDDLLQGKVAIRIQDPLSDKPLAFDRLDG